MKSMMKTVIFSAALMTAGIGVGMAMQQEKGEHPGAGGMDPMMQKMMDAWQAYATPGEHHKALDWKVGTWNGEVKMWMAPQMPEPSVSTCTVKTMWVMDGRYLQSTVEGQFEGQTFQGLSMEGYDNFQKMYVASWVDNMGTGIGTYKAKWDAAKKTMNSTGESPNFYTGKMAQTRGVLTKISENSFKDEMFCPGPDGKEFKCMEITYTRAN